LPPRYIIHIGPLKTASTYIQECLTAARLDLLAAGICYPAELLDENAKFMHMPVVRMLRRNQIAPLRDIFAGLNAQGHATILLSCEHMIFLKPDQLAALRDATGATDIRIVYTSRRWSDRLPSIWNQNLVMGDAQTLPEFLLSLMAGEGPFYMPKWLREQGPGADLNYSLTWQTIETVFGRDALTIFPYSVIMDQGGDVFERFCRDVLGLEAAPSTQLTGTRRWSSLPTGDQEILRVLNQLHLDAQGEPTDQVRAVFMRRRRKFDTARIAAAMEAYGAAIPIDDSAVQFDAAFDAMTRYVDRVAGADVLFERRAKPAKYVQPGYLLRDGVREDLLQVHAAIAAEMAEAPARGRQKKA
jgi:hypothetical protein